MSRRTSEASKAVRIAWLKEQELVSKGKGTRDWTPDQQKEILELGKAYYHSDDPNDINDGKAFEGHHMKSAEAFPEYQGDPENIQFLSRSEHQAAHGGDYRNPTNGYFNPVTKNTQDFGQDKYEPCEIIELSEPVISSGNPTEPSDEKKEIFQNQENEKNLNKEQQKDNPLQRKVSTPPLSFPENWGEVYRAWKSGAITAKEAMIRAKTKRSSFYKLVRLSDGGNREE